MTRTAPAVAFQGASKWFGSWQALREVSLSLKEGECVVSREWLFSSSKFDLTALPLRCIGRQRAEVSWI